MSIHVPDPFNRFQGRKIFALLAVFAVYSLWYLWPGYFGQLSALTGDKPLQSRLFYTGQEAIERINALGSGDEKLKYLALIFDGPFMLMLALVFEALIAFGLRRAGVPSARWLLLFILPIAYLLSDFGENALLALTLATDSPAFGSAAGIFTALKWMTGFSAAIVSVLLALRGLLVRR